jgi:hypothetical protein
LLAGVGSQAIAGGIGVDNHTQRLHLILEPGSSLTVGRTVRNTINAAIRRSAKLGQRLQIIKQLLTIDYRLHNLVSRG